MRREGAVCLGLFGSVSSRDLLPGTDELPMSKVPTRLQAVVVLISGYNTNSTMGYETR